MILLEPYVGWKWKRVFHAASQWYVKMRDLGLEPWNLDSIHRLQYVFTTKRRERFTPTENWIDWLEKGTSPCFSHWTCSFFYLIWWICCNGTLTRHLPRNSVFSQGQGDPTQRKQSKANPLYATIKHIITDPRYNWNNTLIRWTGKCTHVMVLKGYVRFTQAVCLLSKPTVNETRTSALALIVLGHWTLLLLYCLAFTALGHWTLLLLYCLALPVLGHWTLLLLYCLALTVLGHWTLLLLYWLPLTVLGHWTLLLLYCLALILLGPSLHAGIPFGHHATCFKRRTQVERTPAFGACQIKKEEPGNQISWLEIFVVVLGPSRQMPGLYLKSDMSLPSTSIPIYDFLITRLLDAIGPTV
jgi:hypothetical protein